MANLSKKDYNYTDEFGNNYKIKLQKSKYKSSGTIAIEMLYWDDEINDYDSYDMLTTNLFSYPNPMMGENQAYIEDKYADFVEDNNIGEYASDTVKRSYSTWYLYDINTKIF